MNPDQPKNPLTRADGWIAAGLTLSGLIVYLRTLAPDILFGDSAEFQTLAYTLGIAHSTGYPVYLLVVRALGLIPIQSFAWRVNAASALFGALTLAGIYLLVRQITNQRLGGILASLVLGLGYTFWYQSITAGVRTVTTLTVTGILLLLWNWHEDPTHRLGSLFFAAFLACIGIHTTVELLIPAIIIFVLWTLASHPLATKDWRNAILAGIAGAVLGAAVFFLAFLVIDQINTPTSFINVTLIPSRSLWGANMADLDTYFKRVYATVFSLQWRGALFSGDPNFMWGSLNEYFTWMTGKDFPIWMLIVVAVGVWTVMRRRPRLGAFLLIAFLVLFYFIANYKGGTKDHFYLVTYIYLCIMLGAGAGAMLNWVQVRVKGLSNGLKAGIYWVATGILLLVFILPFAGPRINAFAAGKASFVDDPYNYPVDDLSQPRQIASERLSMVPDNAVLALDWQTLYATCYLAIVEQGRTGMTFREASPYPSNNKLPDSLVQELKQDLSMGRPVYVEHGYDNLDENFIATPLASVDLLKLSLR